MTKSSPDLIMWLNSKIGGVELGFGKASL
ncbi:hypothetical protein CCACVL1_05633 [Corchorus capsularis]|uniref:Uncharacterized protein n=1 Tax=Corchorus capsularis TaxID=210143 RepID=A0A1R3JJN1_COCAP|nr:hypothetical protein CCACVL1_05633 [Corchorus capsularis]